MTSGSSDHLPRAQPTRVFISAKSADYEYANQVYAFLIAAGVPTFFSQETLPELGVSDYRKQIDLALDQAEHMVVVTSSVDHVSSSWVEAEWGFFINEKRAGRKPGNLVTVVVGSLQPPALPPSLRYYEVLPFEATALEKLLRYVRELSTEPPPYVRRPTRGRPTAFREAATFGGPPRVHLMAVHPGSGTIATGGFDGAVRLYDLVTRSRRAVIGSRRYWTAGAEGLITALDFSRDGRRLASGHFDGAAHAWNLDDEMEVSPLNTPRVEQHLLMKHDTAIAGLAFSTDGSRLTTASSDGVLKTWIFDAAVGEPTSMSRKAGGIVSFQHLAERQVSVVGLITSSDKSKGTIGRGEIHVQPDGAADVVASVRVNDRFTVIRLSADGRLLAAGSGDGTVRLYALDGVLERLAEAPTEIALSPKLTWRAHSKPIKSIAFFPDSAQVVTAALDRTVIVWDIEKGRESFRLQGGSDEAFASAVPLSDGTSIAAALLDGRIRLWDAI